MGRSVLAWGLIGGVAGMVLGILIGLAFTGDEPSDGSVPSVER